MKLSKTAIGISFAAIAITVFMTALLLLRFVDFYTGSRPIDDAPTQQVERGQHADKVDNKSGSESSSEAPVSAVVTTDSIDLNQPTRYAFITDLSAPRLAVFDTLDKKTLPSVDLKTVAEVIGISRDGGYLVYASRGTKTFYRFDLTTQKQTVIQTKKTIRELVVHLSGRWIAYTGEQGSAIIDMTNKKETPIATRGAVSLVYHPGADSLFVAELAYGRVLQINLGNDSQNTLLDVEQPMTPISVMPNGMALFFVAGGKLQRYSLLDQSLTPLSVEAAAFRPYMTSDSRVILLLSNTQPRQLLAVNAYTYKVKSRHTLPGWQLAQSAREAGRDYIVTGWLEQVAVLADEHGLYSLILDDPDSLQSQAKTSDNEVGKGSIGDMLVQSDTKTLLLTRHRSKQLVVFDVRNRQISAEIALDLQQPNDIVMGETNTLCH